MNELERIVAGLARPAPGSELDRRINSLLTEAGETRRMSWAWLALAAGVGGLGFFLGRQSVSVAPLHRGPWSSRRQSQMGKACPIRNAWWSFRFASKNWLVCFYALRPPRGC